MSNEPSRPGLHPPASGILYAEDFGVDRRRAMPPPPAAPTAPALTQGDIDAACIRAVQAAEAAWAESAEERRAEALAAVEAQFAAAQAEAAAAAELVADGIARTVLGLVAGILPDLSRAHGDTEVRALVRHMAPLLARSTRLVIRAHPSLTPVLAQDVAALGDTMAERIELRPANLPPGDVRLAWEDGTLVRDTAAICAALRDGLAQLGLDGPDITLEPRSLALAE